MITRTRYLLWYSSFLFFIFTIILSATNALAQASQDEDDAGIAETTIAQSYPNGGTLRYDLRFGSGCAPSSPIKNTVNGVCNTLNYYGLISANNQSFTSSSLTYLVDSAVNPGPSTGFTVAVSLDTTSAVTVTQTVFAIGPNALFTLLRDARGFWYTGKQVDGPTALANYLNRAWDPVSPCVTANSCQNDTIYVSFLSNGQVLLDEVAVLTNPTEKGSVVWKSGTLNYGFPVTSFQHGSLTSPPAAVPAFYTVGSVGVGNLPQAFYPTTPSGGTNFPGANIVRLALWTSGTIGTGANRANLQNALLSDQKNYLQALGKSIAINTSWIPCNSGIYQNPTVTTRAAYSPADLRSIIPCATAPDPPTLGSFYNTSENIWFSCNTPASDGGASIISYTFSLNNRPPRVTSTCNYTWADMTLPPGSTYTATVFATNAIGSSPPLSASLTVPLVIPKNAFNFGIYRPSQRLFAQNTYGNFTLPNSQSGDIPVMGDFEGFGKLEFATYRPSTSTWTFGHDVQLIGTTVFGQINATPVPADYDGDGVTDFATFSNGTWNLKQSSTGKAISLVFGTAGDIPVRGNFDGDNKNDFAYFRPSNGTWYVYLSTGRLITKLWGESGDIPVPGDYDGDGKTDFAVFRPNEGIWYVFPSSGTATYSKPWGESGDIPVPGDYDGDGKTDFAVFRPNEGTWYVLYSSGKPFLAYQYGTSGDIPLAPPPLQSSCTLIPALSTCP